MPKISLIISSDKLDKLYPAAILANTSANMGWKAELFFTFWGLIALRKGGGPPEVSSDYSQYKGSLAKMVESGALPEWKVLLREAKKGGKVKIYACSTTMGAFNIKEEDLEDFVDGVVGASTFLSKAENAQITLFVS